jgi:hypothetical protein
MPLLRGLLPLKTDQDEVSREQGIRALHVRGHWWMRSFDAAAFSASDVFSITLQGVAERH